MSDKAQQRLDQIRRSMAPKTEGQKPNRSELNPVKFLIRSSLVFPGRTAMIEEDGTAHSYFDFGARVRSLGQSLQAKFNIQEGDRVGLLCRNTPLMLQAHFAVPLIGGVIVAINTRLNQQEVEYIIEHSGCKIVLYEEDLENFQPAKDGTWVPSNKVISEVASLQSRGEVAGWGFFREGPSSEEDVIAISYTSGTTGRPKGVMSTYRGVALACLNNVMEMNLTTKSRYLWVLPLFHCNGWCFPYSVAAVAGASVMLSKTDPKLIWHHLLNSNITHYCGAPTVQISIINHPDKTRLRNQVTAMIAGSPPSPALINQLEQLNFLPLHTYGLTETYGPSTIEYGGKDPEEKDRFRLMARQGHSYLLSEPVRVVNADMEDVARDGKSVGEVVFRGNMVMKGYYNDPKSTDRAFSGGWFHSGDLAVIEKDGSINLQDRQKDLIISGGENISTVEIEAAIAHHPQVLELAVVSSPHEKWGETPKAFIVLQNPRNLLGNPTAEEKLKGELLEFTRSKLAHFKCPSKWEFVSELPKTGTGKIMKFKLRAKEWETSNKLIG